MSINHQLKLVSTCFILHVALIVLLIASGIFGVNTLMQRQVWVDHTNFILNEIEIAERTFNNADFAGRNQVLSGTPNTQIPAFRQQTFERIAALKERVKDNPVQTEILDTLEKIVAENFAVQDEQLASVIKTDEAIIYKLDKQSAKMRYAEMVGTLYTRLKINEMILLRDDRMPRLTMWQWRLVYFTGGVLFLLMTVTVCLFIFQLRVLKRQAQASSFMEQMKHKSDMGDKSLQKDLNKLATLLNGETVT